MLRPLVVVALATLALSAQTRGSVSANMSFAEAKPILQALHDRLPAELKGRSPDILESFWPSWVWRRDAEIRARLHQGDEDSLVNFLLFGTTFTKQPRALNDSAKLGGRDRAAEILRGRISDLVSGIASPGGNERLQFARRLVERRKIKPNTSDGKAQVRRYILETMGRVVGEVDGYVRTLQSAKSLADPNAELAARSRLFRDRGLSSDTSLLPDFAVERALAELTATGTLGVGSVRRIAVVGPGLDFTDKAEGYDFYPPQTIQPFSVIDSLVRLGLATLPQLSLTTFDLSPRINQHLEAARRRARAGGSYVLELPRDANAGWHPDLVTYWRQLGDRIGEETKPLPAPAGAATVQVRAVRVRPSIVLTIASEDLNIVLQRERLPDVRRFDLVVATNVFVYYDVFEQSLALANVAAMLRPGGILLSNNLLPEAPASGMKSAGAATVAYSDRLDDSDHIVWYVRQ
ncbi:MAG: class I SAM-dependent methyltransferase [Acidobacteriota bacterium]